MDIEMAFKCAASLAAVTTVGIAFYKIKFDWQQRFRDEYNFSLAFIDAVKARVDMHEFCLSKGCHAIMGSSKFKSEEVLHLLSFDAPVEAINDYRFAQGCLSFFRVNGRPRLEYQLGLRTRWIRAFKFWIYLILYAVAALIALSPLLVASKYNTSPADLLYQLSFSVSLFGFIAYCGIRNAKSIHKAERLISAQDRCGL
ncbi:MAG TPA: hypothetical protein PKE57_03125 [Cellvibrionaceae bacterium]|nr:hypothetical protein [Cellvibrionaceae bacterium]HMW46658.1 hypothetical protein [Cellvibrionaceae bacterium]HMW71244.1 hypothetical protein [Cellvibrionaceae bacterium]HNG60949.1 hypothetical protein [Cellvibrionaceae bacterium]